MKITLTATSPVHIGTGQVYHPNEYVVTQTKEGVQFFSRINQSVFIKGLSPDLREELTDAMMDDGFSLSEFFRAHSLNHTECRRYRIENHTGKKDPAEIRECIKTADRPFIPGSSLKGAIRTALLWWEARNDSRMCDMIRTDLENDRNWRGKRSIGSSYVSRVFHCSTERPDPRYDLLRFLQVSDCMSSDRRLSVECVRTSSLKGQSLQPKSYEIYAECVTGTFSGTIGGLDQISRVDRDQKYSYLKDRIRLLGMKDSGDIDAVAPHLNKVIGEWSRWCLDHERKLVADQGAEYEGALDQVKDQVDAATHIRLGFGIGTLYQTLIGLISEQDAELAVELINGYHLGKYPRNEEFGEIVPPYPKSIEFSRSDEAFGWMRFAAE